MSEYIFKNNKKETARKQVEKQDRAAPTVTPPENEQDRVVNLQRIIGNQGVQRLLAGQAPRGSTFVQTKLTVGPANDAYEQEADRVANQVMNAPQPVQRQAEEEELQAKRADIQREGEEEELQAKRLDIQRSEEDELQMKRADIRRAEEDELQMKRPDVQRAEEEEEALQAKRLDIQRKGTEAGFEVGGEVEDQIKQHKGTGQPMSDDARGLFESRFGQDFGSVQVHADAQSDSLNRALDARAFTSGSDIFFRQGEYKPDTPAGKELIAHELTHVVQQGGSVQKKDKGEE